MASCGGVRIVCMKLREVLQALELMQGKSQHLTFCIDKTKGTWEVKNVE